MTMPHLMNCPHSDEGWCLACVKEMGDRLIVAFKDIDQLKRELWCANHEIDCLNGDADYGN